MSEIAETVEAAFQAVSRVQNTIVTALVKQKISPTVVDAMIHELQQATKSMTEVKRKLSDHATQRED